MKLDNKHVLVVGLGKSGMAAARFLLARGVRVSVSEGGLAQAPVRRGVQWLQEKGVYCELGGHSPELFTSVDVVLLSPGVPLDLPALAAARRAGVPIIGELALAPAYLSSPVIAVTGTNGKSTVTTMIGDILQAAGNRVFVGGNLGTPLCEYLAGPQEADWVVLEVSSYQLDSAGAFCPEIGVLLNISPDHLDRYPDYAAYAASKWRLFAHQGRRQRAVINHDDPEIGHLLATAPPTAALFSFGGGGVAGPYQAQALDASGQEETAAVRDHGGKMVSARRAPQVVASGTAKRTSVREPAPSPLSAVPCDRLPAAGTEAEPAAGMIRVRAAAGSEEDEEYELAAGLALEPNRQNALAAVLTARLAGCRPAAVARGLAAFKALPHRLALVATVDGVGYYDDSKATNIGAVNSALKGLVGPVVLIAGGLDKGGDYRLLLPVIREKVRAVVLIGSAREKMKAALAPEVPVLEADDLAAAVRAASSLASPGDAVLLSPACASFDMFTSYAHRGEVFRQAVGQLPATRAGGGALPGHCPVMEAMFA